MIYLSWLERSIHNADVSGSNPPITTNFKATIFLRFMFILAASLARLMTSTRSYCLSIPPHNTAQYNANTLPTMIKVE